MMNQMCEYGGVVIDNGMNQMSTLLPTPKTSNKSKCCVTNNMYEHAAKSLLKTITFELEDIKKWAILDSGATSNFLLSDAPVDEERCTQNPITAKLPDGKKVQSTHEGKLQLYHLPEKARWAHIMPGLRSHSLVSVVKLCDAGCEVHFTKIGCTITYRGRTIVCGRKCVRSGLWMIPITSVPRNREMFNEREANSVQGMEEIAAALEATPGFLANMQ